MTRAAPVSLCAAILLAACVRAPIAPAGGAVSGAPVFSLDGKPVRVDLLARQFLPAGTAAPSGYAAYCYLVFSDRAKDTIAARKAAAEAYLGLFSDVVEASRSASPEHMALILAPVRDADAASALVRSRSLEDFLAAYNYDRASLLVAAFAHAGKRLPRVAVISYPRPLEGLEPVALKDAWVIDLTNPNMAENAFRKLAEALVVGAKEPPSVDNMPLAVQYLMAVFREIGVVAAMLKGVENDPTATHPPEPR
jgi:hypothetical protein